MNGVLTEEQTAVLAGSCFPRIANVIKDAFQDYLDSLKGISSLGIKTNLKARTSASLIHDFIQVRAREEFINDTDIKVNEFNGMFGLLISGRVFIRFKKLTAEMKTSNVKTEQVDLFNKQQLELPGVNQVTLLTAGYVPDAIWTSIQSIFLTCKKDDEVIWHRDLHGETRQVSIFSGSVVHETQSVPEPLVRLKGTKDQKMPAVDNR